MNVNRWTGIAQMRLRQSPDPENSFPGCDFYLQCFSLLLFRHGFWGEAWRKRKSESASVFLDFLGGSALKSNLRRRGRKKKKKTSLPSGVTWFLLDQHVVTTKQVWWSPPFQRRIKALPASLEIADLSIPLISSAVCRCRHLQEAGSLSGQNWLF